MKRLVRIVEAAVYLDFFDRFILMSPQPNKIDLFCVGWSTKIASLFLTSADGALAVCSLNLRVFRSVRDRVKEILAGRPTVLPPSRDSDHFPADNGLRYCFHQSRKNNFPSSRTLPGHLYSSSLFSPSNENDGKSSRFISATSSLRKWTANIGMSSG